MVLGDRLRDAELVRDEPRLVHPAGDRVPLDLEDRDAEGMEDVLARDVQDDGPAPTAAHRGGAGAIDDGHAEFANELTPVGVHEAPSPLEADAVNVESVRIVRGVLEKSVEGEGVDRQAEKQG